MMQRRFLTGLVAFLLLVSIAFGKDKSAKPKPVTGAMPVTATSAKGRELFQKGMEDYENLYLERCNEDWRAAVKEDPSVAVAWAWIAFNGRNPAEVSAARDTPRAPSRSRSGVRR